MQASAFFHRKSDNFAVSKNEYGIGFQKKHGSRGGRVGVLFQTSEKVILDFQSLLIETNRKVDITVSKIFFVSNVAYIFTNLNSEWPLLKVKFV